MKNNYIFTSERLGFRNWSKEDIAAFAALNANMEVMQHFPNTHTKEETKAMITRFQDHYEKYGYTYFATDVLDTGEFIGFIGLAFQSYTSEFTPATDIGWRLKKNAWNKGYATEGATRCLEYAFTTLQLDKVIATCTINNTKSENVMRKIGMTKLGYFKHPLLKEYPNYEECICYGIKNSNFK
ncbi:MAG: GNAT family N-acetyltransferase [Chitinophagales bacterium]|nr:GNAT family N-acetyltransferase [Chitinophagales bacterium]